MDTVTEPLTLTEAARRLNVSNHMVRQALLRRELDGFKIRGQWRVLANSVERLKAGHNEEVA